MTVIFLTVDKAYSTEDNEKKSKTLESECEKKKSTSFDGLFCEAILKLQGIFEPFGGAGGLFDVITNLQIKVTSHISSDEDLDPQNELQGLILSGKTLTIVGSEDGLSSIELPTFDGTGFVLGNQTCNVGDVVKGFDENGNILCKTDEMGSDTDMLQNQIIDLTSRLSNLEKNIGVASDCSVRGPNADLRGVDLSGADLRGVDLSGADLRKIVLRNANLIGADLFGADLSEANLSFGDFRNAMFSYAKLNKAFLIEADLRDAVLRDAVLNFATLNGANLSGANLNGADLFGANLSGADLSCFGHSICV